MVNSNGYGKRGAEVEEGKGDTGRDVKGLGDSLK